MMHESSGAIVAGSWNLSQMRHFSVFGRRAQSSFRRPKWFQKRKQKNHQRSTPKATKRDSNSTVDLEQDERDILKISAIRNMAGFVEAPSSSRGNDALDAEATATVFSDSDDTGDDYRCFDDFGESSVKSVRFADEEGLPMEQVVHITEDVRESDVVVLCLSPQHKKFEFVHVGYHTDGEEKSNATRSTKVSELLMHLPRICTDSLFQNCTFDKVYRTNHKSNGILEKLVGCSIDEDCDIPLEDCTVHISDILVATVTGCTEEQALSSMDPLLSNAILMKTMRRARRSRRGLKWIPQRHAEAMPQSRTSRAFGMIQSNTEAVLEKVSDCLGLFMGDDDGDDDGIVFEKDAIAGDLTEEEQQIQERQERFEQELMHGVVMVTGLTVMFSLLGM
jgi:hypothetical protein